MTKRRNRRLAAVAALAVCSLAVGACDEGLTEINENPNAAESVPANNVLLSGVRDVAQNSGERGTFGKWTMLYHAENWAQHIAQPVYLEEDRYTPRAGVQNNIWDEMYFALADLAEVKRLSAEDEGGDNIWAIAEVMTVYGFMVLTDYFDAIPYFEALQLRPDGGETFPAYDDPATIYPDLISRLATAAGMFDPTALITFADYDPVYQGDVDGWALFANSLRLRLAMRMVNQNAGGARSAFEAAWASNIFTSVADQADVDWAATQPGANPVYEGVVFAGRTGDFRMSESLVDRLAAFADPRLPIYADPARSDGAFRGLRNGLYPSEYDPELTPDAFSWIGEYFMTPTTPSNLLSYAEVLFLGAEAAEMGWAVGGQTAEELYEAGITAAMTDVGVAPGDITAYLAQPQVDYQTGTYVGVDAIHMQKWIALFLAGPEAYNDLRRYGWNWNLEAGTTGTSLEPAEGSAIGDMFPGRMPYPDTEPLVNPENYPGDAAVTDAVWWMP